MSAKSYVCNDCGISLRSIKEAQDHGETSGTATSLRARGVCQNTQALLSL
jgi:hypothetical protein